jgi:hypothetical protein
MAIKSTQDTITPTQQTETIKFTGYWDELRRLEYKVEIPLNNLNFLDDDRGPEALMSAVEDWWMENCEDYALAHEPTSFLGLGMEDKGVYPITAGLLDDPAGIK